MPSGGNAQGRARFIFWWRAWSAKKFPLPPPRFSRRMTGPGFNREPGAPPQTYRKQQGESYPRSCEAVKSLYWRGFKKNAGKPSPRRRGERRGPLGRGLAGKNQIIHVHPPRAMETPLGGSAPFMGREWGSAKIPIPQENTPSSNKFRVCAKVSLDDCRPKRPVTNRLRRPKGWDV